MLSRTPHGVRGLKFSFLHGILALFRRTPHGVRGLKFNPHPRHNQVFLSHPAWGAWIEMHLE